MNMEQHYNKLHERDHPEKVIAQKGIITDIERKIDNCNKLAKGALNKQLKEHYIAVRDEFINELERIKELFKNGSGD